jgi:DNA repair photolyase
MIPKINLIQAKSILIKSGLPGSDYVINPYNGCLFGCMYCYAAQIARWKHPKEKWGTYIDVKNNASELLRKELYKMEKKTKSKNFGSIFLSSVTDPYMSMESKYRLTRKCLEVLADFGYTGLIGIQTKSPLIIRDIEIIKKIKNCTVGFTVTTLDDKISRFLEVMAPPVTKRIEALKKLHEAKISTYAFIGPILPYFVNDEKKISGILDELQKVGVKEVWFEHLHINPGTKGRLYDYLKKESPELLLEFEKADNGEYRKKVDGMIKKALAGRNMKLGLGKVIFHTKPQKK